MLKFLTSFGFALIGIGYALCHETNFRVQWLCATAVFILLDIFDFGYIEQISVIILSAGVLSLELMNSSLEQLADEQGSQYSVSKKNAKDLAAGSVCLFSLSALLIFLLIINQHLTPLLSKLNILKESLIYLIILTVINFFMCIKNIGLFLSILLIAINTVLHGIIILKFSTIGIFLTLSIFFHSLLLSSHLRRLYS